MKYLQEELRIINGINTGEISGEDLREVAKFYVGQAFNRLREQEELIQQMLVMQQREQERLMFDIINGVIHYGL